MSSSLDHRFPSPIGGLPFPHDFLPALLFTILYALTGLVAAYRMMAGRSRTHVIIGTTIFTVERIIDLAIRAAEAEKPSIHTASFFVGWLQSAYALGFLGTTLDLSNLARLFVVKTTEDVPRIIIELPSTHYLSLRARFVEEQRLKAIYARVDVGSSPYHKPPAEDFADEPQVRALLQRIGLASVVLRIQAMALAAASGGLYYKGITSESQAVLVQYMRYASAIIALCLQLLALGEVLWALVTRPKRTPRVPALYLCSMICILMITTVYRLAAMGNHTTSLTSTAPGSLNSPTAKALFYALHIAPEWLTRSAMLLVVNVKELYGISTGLNSL
ncbi:uncharacterized protein C8Q71DRAFT_483287 [Rhodofomes roseus]|uniref:Uncharacterized protein n=1 Tax=Rhodofomes roseus TaxID=34475 RepID=A0ABQ8KPL9_9APHY|nr:uncharacterized protein C8Q71DRAFT_483287 [Rhodofomes roseus]KAH9840256.1 hypothetical protein C8Q71DRAFT_483287 [Rhodofomes roseus]